MSGAGKQSRAGDASALGGAPPPPRRRPATRSAAAAACARELQLPDVIGVVAQRGYAREANACAGLCRATWRCVPADEGARALWRAIIDLPHGGDELPRLLRAAQAGDLRRVRELCDWRAAVEARSGGPDGGQDGGQTALVLASRMGHCGVVRELLARGANAEAAVASYGGATTLFGRPTR